MNDYQHQTSLTSNDNLSNILEGLKKIRQLAHKSQDTMDLMKIREEKHMDSFRTFVQVFLIHSKRKIDWRFEKYQTRIGKLFTIFDEALVLLLMINCWSCYEDKARIEFSTPRKKDMDNSPRGRHNHQDVPFPP